jgi:RNA polymerase sigma factor (sigma-70 family)
LDNLAPWPSNLDLTRGVHALRAWADGHESSATGVAFLAWLLNWVRPALYVRLDCLADAADAVDDLAQTIALRVLRGAAGCRSVSDPGVRRWIGTILRRAVADLWRNPQPIGGSVPLDAIDEFAAADPEVGELDADAARGGARRAAEVATALRALPTSQRHLLWRRVVEGASWATVAAELKTTVGGARRRYAKALRRLAKQLPPSPAGAAPAAKRQD